jgi:hypothetical protein
MLCSTKWEDIKNLYIIPYDGYLASSFLVSIPLVFPFNDSFHSFELKIVWSVEGFRMDPVITLLIRLKLEVLLEFEVLLSRFVGLLLFLGFLFHLLHLLRILDWWT